MLNFGLGLWRWIFLNNYEERKRVNLHFPMFLSLSLKAASSSWLFVLWPCSLSSAAINSWFQRSSAMNSSFCRNVAMRSSSISKLRSILASVAGGIRRNIGGNGPNILGIHFLRIESGTDSSSISLKINIISLLLLAKWMLFNILICSK